MTGKDNGNPVTSHAEPSKDADQRTIKVSNIAEGVNEDKLQIHFMRKSNGGGDVENITLLDPSTAKITFSDESAVEGVLAREQTVRGQKVIVERWPGKGNEEAKPPRGSKVPETPKDSYERIQVFDYVHAFVRPEKSRYITDSWAREVKARISGVEIKKEEGNGAEIVGKWDTVTKVRSLLQIEAKTARRGRTTETQPHKVGTSDGPPHVNDGPDGSHATFAQLHHNTQKQVDRVIQTNPDDPQKIIIVPDIWCFLKQVDASKVLDIIQKNKAVIVLNDKQTEAWFYGSSAADSDPDSALDEFTNLYQQTHNSIVCKTFDPHTDHSIPSAAICKAVDKLKKDYPRVMLKTSEDKGVVFYGTEKDVQEARAAICEHLGISSSRGRRRRGAAEPRGVSRRWGATGGGNFPTTEWFSYTTRGIEIEVSHGDITQQLVDVIANAANEDLSHGGGVAGAISKAGGPSVQKESNRHVKTHGRLRVTETAVTSGGMLPCKNIIHAVGPRWQRGHEGPNQDRQLRQTCYNILAKASITLGARTVAIPAISSGIFGMPKQKCADSLLSGLLEFLESANPASCTLRRICFIDMDETTVKVLADTFERKFSSRTTATTASPYGDVSRPPNDQYSQPRRDSTGPRSSYADQGGTREGSASDGDGADGKDEDCSICMSEITGPKSLPCKHTFCRGCIDTALSYNSQCPVCKAIVGELKGNQPPGHMDWRTDRGTRLPGYENCGAIVINYHFLSGTQGGDHPNPGRRFSGTSRRAFLPNNDEGRELVQLLKRAFDNRLVFTIGTSVTTGATDTVVWNDIHHKTTPHGGASGYGYPDPGYLGRLREELAAKGIK